MSVRLRDVDYTRAARYLNGCSFNPDPAAGRRNFDGVTLTEDAVAVLEEIEAEQPAADELTPYDLDDQGSPYYEPDSVDMAGFPLRVDPSAAFTTYVGRLLAGVLVPAVSIPSDRRLVGVAGTVLAALDVVGSGLSWVPQPKTAGTRRSAA